MSKHLAKNVSKSRSAPVPPREETASYMAEEPKINEFYREADRSAAEDTFPEESFGTYEEPRYEGKRPVEDEFDSYEDARSGKSKKKKNRKKAAESYDDYDSYEDARSGKSKKKKGRALPIIIIILAILIILAELAYIFFGNFYTKLNITAPLTAADRAESIARFVQDDASLNQAEEEAEEEDADNPDTVTAEEVEDMQAKIQAQLAASGVLMSNQDVINILLVGTDTRSSNTDENSRSDVMLLVSLNSNTKRIVLTSFMRDIYTYIPDYGYNRLNAPYAIAGADYLIETLEADFGVDIDNYAAIDFYAFADMIDAIDGIDLALTDSEVDFINSQAYNGEQAQLGVGTGSVYLNYSGDGMYHLNGTQALAHCRNRSSSGSDFDRTSRQRAVISAIIEKAKTVGITEMYDLANVILPTITTDMTQGECLSLLLKSPEYMSYDVVTIRIPADNEYTNATINGMSVLSIDFTASTQLLQDTIYGTANGIE